MTVFKYLVKAAFRQRLFILMYLVIFLIMSVLTSGGAKQQTSFERQKANVAVMRLEDSAPAKDLEQYLFSTNKPQRAPKDLSDAKEMILLGEADVVVLLEKGFAADFQANKPAATVLYDNSNMGGHLVENEVFKYLSLLRATEQNGVYDAAKVKEALSHQTELQYLNTDAKGRNLNEWYGIYYNFAGYVVMALFIAVLGMVMSDFHQEAVRARIDASSKKLLSLQWESYLGQFAVAVVLALFIVGAGFAIQRGNVAGVDLPRYLLNFAVFSLAALGISFLINNVTNNRNIKAGLSTVVALGLSFISGVMVPQSLLAPGVLQMAKLFPVYYFVKANSPDMNGLSAAAPYIGIQLLFAALFFAAGAFFAKMRKDKPAALR